MTKIKTLIGTALCASFMLFSLAACGDNETNPDGNNPETPKTTYTVTFDTNGGSEIASQQVEEGGRAVKPENDPAKTDYVFSGWCKDAGLETAYDFETETITSATTIYASWASASDTSVAKFYWNYDGATEEVFQLNFRQRFENSRPRYART